MKKVISESLSFDDVLIVPQLSNIRSRGDVDISTVVGGYKLSLPIISSPMDTVTESKMAIALGKAGGLGIIHRFMSIEQQMDEVSKVILARSESGQSIPVAYAIGVGSAEFERYLAIQKKFGAEIDFVAIDIANGHSSLMKDMISSVKGSLSGLGCGQTKIIAGNVATGEGWLYLAKAGADCVRVGVGGGCFTPQMPVFTNSGMKAIESVEIGDKVLTHTGEWENVIDIMSFDRDEEIVSINGIQCTKNHEFYVVDLEDAKSINDENIHQYAFWVEAANLDQEKHMLIRCCE